MNAQTIELILKVLQVAGPIIAQVPTLGAKWIANRNEVLKMIREERNPTPEEHARLSREMDSLMGSLAAALTTADALAVANARANEASAAAQPSEPEPESEVEPEETVADPAEEIDPVEEVAEEVEVAAEAEAVDEVI